MTSSTPHVEHSLRWPRVPVRGSNRRTAWPIQGQVPSSPLGRHGLNRAIPPMPSPILLCTLFRPKRLVMGTGVSDLQLLSVLFFETAPIACGPGGLVGGEKRPRPIQVRLGSVSLNPSTRQPKRPYQPEWAFTKGLVERRCNATTANHCVQRRRIRCCLTVAQVSGAPDQRSAKQ